MADDIIVLASGLYRFMLRTEPLVASPRAVTAEVVDPLLPQAETLLEGLAVLRRRVSSRMVDTVDELGRSLRALVAELSSQRPLPRQVKEHWDALGKQYETLVEHIRQLRLSIPRDVALGQLKPRNVARNLFHAGMGIVGIGLYEFVLSRELTLAIGGGLLALFVCLEIARRCSPRCNQVLYGRWFARIGRPREEHRACTSTWYLAGLVLGVWWLPQHAIELGCLVLAFGDPAASLLGKRWGRIRLVGDKSLIGTAGFFVVSMVLCFGFVAWRLATVPLPQALLGAAAVAAAGAFTELVSAHINDNLSIPLVAGAVAAFVL